MTGTLRLDGLRPHPREIAAYVRALARATALPDEAAYRLRLAADEVVTNIVLHGYRAEGGAIDLSSGASDRAVWLVVEDDAPRFDPRSHDPGPRLRSDPTDGGVGGYGLLLALASLDEFVYAYEQRRNRCLMTVLRPAYGGTDDPDRARRR